MRIFQASVWSLRKKSPSPVRDGLKPDHPPQYGKCAWSGSMLNFQARRGPAITLR